MGEKKKVGIVCDNYKIDKFKEALDAGEYVYKIVPYVGETSIIKIEAFASDVIKVGEICQNVEKSFKK